MIWFLLQSVSTFPTQPQVSWKSYSLYLSDKLYQCRCPDIHDRLKCVSGSLSPDCSAALSSCLCTTQSIIIQKRGLLDGLFKCFKGSKVIDPELTPEQRQAEIQEISDETKVPVSTVQEVVDTLPDQPIKNTNHPYADVSKFLDEFLTAFQNSRNPIKGSDGYERLPLNLKEMVDSKLEAKQLLRKTDFPEGYEYDSNGVNLLIREGNSVIFNKIFSKELPQGWSDPLLDKKYSGILKTIQEDKIAFAKELMPNMNEAALERGAMVYKRLQWNPELNLQESLSTMKVSNMEGFPNLKQMHFLNMEEVVQQNQIKSALEEAGLGLKKLIDDLDLKTGRISSDATFRDSFKKMWGGDSDELVNQIRKDYIAISENMKDLTFAENQIVGEVKELASTMFKPTVMKFVPNQIENPFITIPKGSSFFKEMFSELRSSTIVHELSHYILGTEDHVYATQRLINGKVVPEFKPLYNEPKTDTADKYGMFLYVSLGKAVY